MNYLELTCQCVDEVVRRRRIKGWNSLAGHFKVSREKLIRGIHQVEEEFGYPLLSNSDGMIFVTEFGRQFHARCSELLSLRQRGSACQVVESVKVGVEWATFHPILPEIIGRFRTECTTPVSLELEPMCSEAKSLVLTRQWDVAFGTDLYFENSKIVKAISPTYEFLLAIVKDSDSSKTLAEETNIAELGPHIVLAGVAKDFDTIRQHRLGSQFQSLVLPSYESVLDCVEKTWGVGLFPSWHHAIRGPTHLESRLRFVHPMDMPKERLIAYLPRSLSMLTDPARFFLEVVEEVVGRRIQAEPAKEAA